MCKTIFLEFYRLMTWVINAGEKIEDQSKPLALHKSYKLVVQMILVGRTNWV